jgi:hypothetical protein
LLLHQTPQITEGFQVFQQNFATNRENLACSRTSGGITAIRGTVLVNV